MAKRRTPWTPIFNPDPRYGAVAVGSTPGTTPSPTLLAITLVGTTGSTTDLDNGRGVAISGSHAFVACNTSNRFTSVDISTPVTPVVAHSVNDATNLAGAQDVAISGSYAYVACQFGVSVGSLTVVDISDPTSSYWRQLAVDSQSSHYELLLLANGKRIDDVVWDVVRKPGIRPKQIAAKEVARILEEGTYCGQEMDSNTLERLGEDPRETQKLFAARVAQETTENPDKYFARRSNPRTNDQIAEYAEELWGTGNLIREARNKNQHFRNSGACFNYGTPCVFLPLCSGTDEPESEYWQPKQKPAGHVGGKNVLSHSRIRCFQTCRRKHYYEYELGIERVDADRKEALFFGSLWHETLDVWWHTFNERKDDGDSNEQPVGSTGSQQPQLA